MENLSHVNPSMYGDSHGEKENFWLSASGNEEFRDVAQDLGLELWLPQPHVIESSNPEAGYKNWSVRKKTQAI